MKEEHVYWSGNYLPLKHVLFLKSAFKKSDAILNIIEMIILKDDALKLLHSICQQIWKTHQWPQDWKRSVSFQSQRICQGCILSPCLFNLYAEYIMHVARLDEAQAGIKIARRNINNLRYADNHPYDRKQRGTKEPLDGRGE